MRIADEDKDTIRSLNGETSKAREGRRASDVFALLLENRKENYLNKIKEKTEKIKVQLPAYFYSKIKYSMI